MGVAANSGGLIPSLREYSHLVRHGRVAELGHPQTKIDDLWKGQWGKELKFISEYID
jgi:hypothetical protein